MELVLRIKILVNLNIKNVNKVNYQDVKMVFVDMIVKLFKLQLVL